MRIELDVPFTVKEICDILKSDIPSSQFFDRRIGAICTDSRECREHDLFVALKGEKDCGEKYIDDVKKKGCHIISGINRNDVIHAPDTAEALLAIARAYKDRISPKHTVAITGSVGKSTTVKFISAILSKSLNVHATAGNFNNHIGVPITLLSMKKGTEVLVTELGMNHKGEISALSKAVAPDIGLITSIGTAHIGNLGSRSEIAAAKLEILDGMTRNTLLLPYNEPLLSDIDGALYVGRNTSLSDFSLDDQSDEAFSFKCKDRAIGGIRFFDRREHLLHDLALAISLAYTLGLSDNDILNGINAITSDVLRQRFIELDGFTIFDDSYNASLESVCADLGYLASMQRPTGAFLGDVLELGKSTESIHNQIGIAAAEHKIGKLYLYGKYADCVAEGALCHGMNERNVFINKDLSAPQISIAHMKENHAPGEIILFKASHKLRLDKIADLMKSEERTRNDNN